MVSVIFFYDYSNDVYVLFVIASLHLYKMWNIVLPEKKPSLLSITFTWLVRYTLYILSNICICIGLLAYLVQANNWAVKKSTNSDHLTMIEHAIRELSYSLSVHAIRAIAYR